MHLAICYSGLLHSPGLVQHDPCEIPSKVARTPTPRGLQRSLSPGSGLDPALWDGECPRVSWCSGRDPPLVPRPTEHHGVRLGRRMRNPIVFVRISVDDELRQRQAVSDRHSQTPRQLEHGIEHQDERDEHKHHHRGWRHRRLGQCKSTPRPLPRLMLTTPGHRVKITYPPHHRPREIPHAA